MSGILGIMAGAGLAFSFQPTIAASTNNYNLRAAAVAAGWDQIAPLVATITINSGVQVGSASTGTPAFDTGASFPAGTRLALVNNGAIRGLGGAGGSAGAGGAGGPGLWAQTAIDITNNGTIAGGGGGGGKGGDVSKTLYTNDLEGGGCNQPAGTAAAYGGAGGNGAGSQGSATGGSGGTTASGSDCMGPYSITGGTGGSGGGYGSAGGTGVGGYSGGAAGSCTIGNANITWLATGTRQGPLN